MGCLSLSPVSVLLLKGCVSCISNFTSLGLSHLPPEAGIMVQLLSC